MSVGLALLQKMIKDGRPLGSLIEAGITDTMWSAKEKKVYEFMRDYTLSHGGVPRERTVEVETGVRFGEFPDEPMGYWIDSMMRRHRSQTLDTSIEEAQSLLAGGHIDQAHAILRNAVVDLDVVYGRSVYRFGPAAERVLEQSKERQMSASLGGVSFGFPSLDMITDGAQRADTIAIVGETSVGKTYLLLRMALSAYVGGEVPLIASMEMNPTQCYRRLLALYSKVSATEIRVGRLTYWFEQKLRAAIEQMKEDVGGREFYVLDGSLTATMDELAIRVQELRPTILYVDGAYLIKGRGGFKAKWEQVSSSAEDLKMMATKFNIPIIATYQFNRKGPGSINNIGLSATIGQVASVVIGMNHLYEVSSTGTKAIVRNRRVMELLKGREGEWGKLLLRYAVKRRMLIEEIEVLNGFEPIG